MDEPEYEWEDDEYIEPQTITIELDEYEQLLYDSRFLNNLKAMGVDNWEGYSDAYNMPTDQ